jgi:uncharacterized membrane protein YfcA
VIWPEHGILLLVLGLVAGLLSGILGIGSGIILVPALVHLAFPQKDAQGIALAVMVPMALVGAIRYKMHPEIELNPNVILVLGLTAVIGALLGATLAGHLHNLMLRRLFATLIIIVGIRMWLTK